jgi:genome maintenance exonuclease 1
LYSETLGLAGRTDVIAEYDGVASIIDFKTSLNMKKEAWIDNYFEQGTAYSLMYEELTGIKIEQIVIIISVDHEDKPQEFIKNRNDYVDSLKNKIEAYKKEHSNVY